MVAVDKTLPDEGAASQTAPEAASQTAPEAASQTAPEAAPLIPRRQMHMQNGPKFKARRQEMENEKVDWARYKLDKKKLKLMRKQARENYEIIQQVKKLYEQVKCRRTKNKHILVEQMYNLMNAGNLIVKTVMTHDSSRMIQCMLKYATPELRDELSEKLIPHTPEMCQSKFAHFCVNRMLKYGSPNTKKHLGEALYGNVVRLCSHKTASKIVDFIYLNGKCKQRRYLRQEFYGDLYKFSKDENIKSLKDTFENCPNMKASIMGAVKAYIDHIANKELLDNSLVHAVLLEYIQATNEEDLEETVTPLAAYIPYMLSTKTGTEAAILCFYYSTSKTRRAVIKKIKEHLIKISKHEYGHTFLIALLNALDDTKAIKKFIFDPLYGELKSLVSDSFGRRVVEWMVAPGDTSCFHPAFIETIELGLKFGKKDKATRRQEILAQVEGPISVAIAEDPAFWLSNSHIGLVTANIVNHLSDEHYEKAVTALAPVIADINWRVADVSDENEPKPHDVETYISDAINKRKNKNVALELISSDEETDDEKEKDDDDEKENGEMKKNDQENDERENGEDEDGEVEGTPAKKPKIEKSMNAEGEGAPAENSKMDAEEEGAPAENPTVVETVDADNETQDAETENLTVNEAKEEEVLPTVMGIEDAGMHHVIKKIIRGDIKRESTPFGNQLFKHLNIDVLKFWLGINRACFVLVQLVENSPDLLDKCRIMFEQEEGLYKILEDAKLAGAKVLGKKLKSNMD